MSRKLGLRIMRIKRRSMFASLPFRPPFFAASIWANMDCFSVLVNTWNHASFPGFKSRIWNTDATPDFKKSGSSSRPSASRSSSSASKVKTTL